MTTVAAIRDQNSDERHPQLAAHAFDACPEPLAVLDEIRVVEANAAFRRMLAPDRRQLKGKTLSELGIDDRSLPATFASGRFAAQGRIFRVISLASPQPSPEMFRSQKLEAVGRMVSGVAHDFNNLLTGVILCCDLMLANLEADSPLRRYAEEMKMATAQGASLIEQLLTVLREEPARHGPLSWNNTVNDMRNLLARLIGENIELATDLTDGLPPVSINAVEARQIILNLVLNARDAMPAGGRILLTTRRSAAAKHGGGSQSSAGWVEFEVSDNGCGMDEKIREIIFQPFFTTKTTGNGLGLATVKNIVDKQGGSIEVTSEPGRGTQIRIGLPTAYNEAA
jgi:signal transduction histidine kinase